MSSYDFLRVALHSRFCKAFGPPHGMQGDGTQWSFAPNIPPPHSPIHIVITGSGPPAIWIFDPSCAKDGLEYSQVRQPEDIDALIEHIRGRIHLPIAPPVVHRASAPVLSCRAAPASSATPASPTSKEASA